MNKIKITSPGWGSETRVTDMQGNAVPGVQEIRIQPISRDTLVKAVLTIALAELDIEAEPILSLETLEASAKFWGYKLTPLTEG
jgi:hypothetical protein